MALVQWERGMKVMHEGRLEGVSVASNSQKRDREKKRARERGVSTRVLQTLALVIDLKGSLDRK